MIGDGKVHMHRHFVVMAAVAGSVGQHPIVLELVMHAGGQFADLVVGAVHGRGHLDVACLHQVAVNGDRTQQILVVGARSTLLADDGDEAVISFAVAIAVEVLDRLDLGGVRREEA